jgi:hypothetical protein
MLLCGRMLRRLDVKQSLLRSPCPIDPSTLPRVTGGFGCANCGHTVVDVAGLTLEEVVALRQKTASGAERICAAYTVDREQRVQLRAGPGSSAVIAVAVGVLLAACETGSGEKRADPRPRASSTQTLEVHAPTSVTPPGLPASSVETKVVESAIPSAAPEARSAKAPAAPGCTPGHASKSAPKGQGHKGRASDDSQMLAGY